MAEVYGGGVDDGSVGRGDAAPGGGGEAEARKARKRWRVVAVRRRRPEGWRRGGVERLARRAYVLEVCSGMLPVSCVV